MAPATGLSTPVAWANAAWLMEFQDVGDLLAALPDLVDEQDGGRQPALELVGRLDAEHAGALAPGAVGIAVGLEFGVLVGNNVGGRQHLVLDRGIELVEHRQRDQLGEVDRARRPRDLEACFSDIDVEVPLACLARGLGAGNRRLDIGGKQAQHLFLLRPRAGPIGKTDQSGDGIDEFVLAMIGEHDRARRQRSGGKRRQCRRLLELELLRCRAQRQGECCRQRESQAMRFHGGWDPFGDPVQ